MKKRTVKIIKVIYVLTILSCLILCCLRRTQSTEHYSKGRNSSHSELLRISSHEKGITDFDITVKEIKRESNISILNIPGYHERTAPASRWIMCVYTEIAIKRGFKYWIVVYPDSTKEDIIIGFPKSDSKTDLKALGSQFNSTNLFPPDKATSIDIYCQFCGLECN